MKLPPLNALRAFEAAARTGSFAAAAKELGVSSAAVSQQVRKLEIYLGRNVFFRNNNQIQLTDAGRDLYQNAAAALAQISTFTAGFLQPSGRRPLVVSVLPSLAERWLPGVLGAMGEAPVRVLVEEDPADMVGPGVDIRFAYGGELYPGFWVRPVFHDTIAPVAAPALARAWEAAAGDLSAVPLIEMDWGPSFSRTPLWADWCLAAGLMPPEGAAVTVPGVSTALALAERGAGVTLGHLTLAREALEAGRLVQLSQAVIQVPQPYVAVVAHARLRHRRVQAALSALGLSK